MQFNEKLTSLRKSMGLSQEELGAELKVSRQTISKWESAQSYPDFQRLVLLSDYFGLTLDELVRDVDVADVRKISAAKNWIPSTTTWASPKNSSSGISSSPVQALWWCFWCCCPLPCTLSLSGSIQPKSPGRPIQRLSEAFSISLSLQKRRRCRESRGCRRRSGYGCAGS